jgi:hypothetical protein
MTSGPIHPAYINQQAGQYIIPQLATAPVGPVEISQPVCQFAESWLASTYMPGVGGVLASMRAHITTGELVQVIIQ